MITTYSYDKAKQSFDLIFKKAFHDGKVKIRKGEQVFILMPETRNESPLDLEGIHMDITLDDIISSIHESRKC